MTNSRLMRAGLAVAALTLWVSGARAQSRNSVALHDPRLQSVGEGSSVYTFQQYSYGLESLQAPSRSYGGVLQSSIDSTDNFSVYRGGAYAPAAGILGGADAGMSIPRAGSTYGVRPGSQVGDGLDLRVDASVTGPMVAPQALAGGALAGRDGLSGMGNFLADPDQRGLGTYLAMQDDTVFGAARAYLRKLEATSRSPLRAGTQPITTLVPEPESPYREYMLKGDRAFRAGNYRDAYASFEIANDIGGRDAESFICLAHAQFALSRYSYAKASYFLQQALKHMPELPLADLRPRAFFGDLARFASHLVALQEHAEKNPADGEAMLLLAYFRWFAQTRDLEATHKALARALGSALRAGNARLAEAVETFWDGVVASGKASGKLEPAPDPAAKPGGDSPTPPAGKPGEPGGAARQP